MNDDELLRAMCESYWNAAPSIANSMRSILELLHAHGYRRCAEGQAVTQYCSAWAQADKACRDLTEKVIPNIRERAEKAEAEVARLQARDEEWQRKASAWMASPEAAQRLDGYRELAQRLNAAEAEVERLRQYLRDICNAIDGERCPSLTEWALMQQLARMGKSAIDAIIDAARRSE